VKLAVNSRQITHSRGVIKVDYHVLDAREIGDVVVVIFDYMEFPRDLPARNLFGYAGKTGKLLWRAADIGMGAADAYTNIISESPLLVGNFAGFNCTIDTTSGQILGNKFTK